MSNYTITIREGDSSISVSMEEFYQIMKLNVPEMNLTIESIEKLKSDMENKCNKRAKRNNKK